MIYFRSRSSDPVTVKRRELTEEKAVLWTSGTGNLRVEPNTNRMSRISTATDGFSNPVYSMEDAISTCETDDVTGGDLVHNPLYVDEDMLQSKTCSSKHNHHIPLAATSLNISKYSLPLYSYIANLLTLNIQQQ